LGQLLFDFEASGLSSINKKLWWDNLETESQKARQWFETDWEAPGSPLSETAKYLDSIA
jgi:hypothetical protein